MSDGSVPYRAGTAGRTLDVLIADAVIAFRCSWCAVTPLVAWVVGPAPGARWWRLTVILAILVWGGGVFAICQRLRRLPAWLVTLDAILFAIPLLTVGWLLPSRLVGDGGTWVFASATASVFLAAWGLPVRYGVLVPIGVMAAYVAGIELAGSRISLRNAVLVAAVYPTQYVLGLLIVRTMRYRTGEADSSLAALIRLRQARAVTQARAEAAHAHRLMLHDTVLATLTAVARGNLRNDPERLRQRARADLDTLTAPLNGSGANPDAGARALVAGAKADADARGLHLDVTAPEAACHVPPHVAAAMAGAVREALSNVTQHARTDKASLVLTAAGDTIQILVRDNGCGFDPSSHRTGVGLPQSIARRMSTVDGEATVESRPGHGTTVTLRWPARGAPRAERREESRLDRLLGGALTGGFGRALTVAALLWHGYSGIQLVSHLDVYRSATVSVFAWLVLGAAGIWLLRHDKPGRATTSGRVLLVLVLVSTGMAIAQCPGTALFDKSNWALGSVGWFLVAMAVHCRRSELLAALAAVGAFTIARAAVELGASRQTLGPAVSLVLIISYLQFAALMVFHQLGRRASVAAANRQQIEDLELRLSVERAVHRDQAQQARQLQAELVPLMTDLASGAADPVTARVRQEAELAAGALRLAVEHADPDGIAPRMLAQVTAAARRQRVVLELRLDDARVCPDARAALLDVLLTALRHAQPGEATITLSGSTHEATATVVLRGCIAPHALRRNCLDMAAEHVGIEVDALGGGRLYLEARWSSPSG